MGVKRVYYSYEDINHLLDNIYKQCKDEIDFVTGIPRGGTILAVLYSHRFDIPYLEYTSNHYPRLLIIDDIADSGKTISDMRKELTNPKFATLHYKTSSIVKPEYFAKEIPDDYGWIVYPWEKEDSKTIQDYLDN